MTLIFCSLIRLSRLRGARALTLAIAAASCAGCAAATSGKAVAPAHQGETDDVRSFVREADAACRQMAEQNRRFKITPGSTDKATDALLAGYTEARSTSVARLGRLTAPPSLRQPYRRYVRLLTEDIVAGRAILHALRANDLTAMLAAGKRHASLIGEAAGAARAIGLRTCAALK